MSIFKRKKKVEYYDPEPAERRFDAMMELVKDLNRKDYNKLKKAMDLAYDAYSAVRGIETQDEAIENTETKFELSPEEA